jgi:predicted alpha/beta-fold hydrolase
LQYLDAIRVPTLFIQAQDDRLIPFDVFSTPALRANPLIELRATESGGHLGFLGCRPHRFWLDETIVEWLQSHSH